MNFPIDLSNTTESVFLCSWNSDEIVQIHTKQSLKDMYGKTNLFDDEEDFISNDVGMTFEQYLDYMSLGAYHIFDNLRIERIN